MPDEESAENPERLDQELPNGDRLQFDDYAALKAFAENELESWKWVEAAAQGQQPLVQGLKQLRNPLTQMVGQIDQYAAGAGNEQQRQQNRTQILNLLKTLATGGYWLPPTDPRSHYVKELSEEQPQVGAFAWLAFVQPQSLQATTSEAVQGLIRAHLFQYGMTAETAAAERLALDEVRKGWEEFSGASKEEYAEFSSAYMKLRNDIGSLRSEQETKFEEMLDEGVKKLEAIAKTYDEKLALQAPVDYWTKKRQQHRVRVRWIWAGFVVSTGLVVAILGSATVTLIPELLTDSPVPTDLGYWPVAVLGGLATLLLWPVRLISRTLLSNLHLGSDAEERVTMANTYLSLIRSEDSLEEKDRKLILETLFRPAATGIVKDDGLGRSASALAARIVDR